MSNRRRVINGIGVSVCPDASSQSTSTIINNVNVASPQSPSVAHSDTGESSHDAIEPGTVEYAPDANPYASLQTRDVATATENMNDIKSVIPNDSKLAEALSLIIDALYNNPLIVNKLVIVPSDVLAELISILTDADNVVVNTDVECGCGIHKYDKVDSIWVTRAGSHSEFKYAYPEAKRILDKHHISTKFVCG